MKGSIAAINREARERGMSYGKYLAFRAAQKAPASSREGETTAEPKRSMPPGASLGLEEPGREQAAKRGQALRQARLRAGLSLEQAARRMDVTASAVRQWENVQAICSQYHIPPDTRETLREYVDPAVKTLSREATVILFADSIVTAIRGMFQKNPKAELDYDRIIESVFTEKFESGVLYNSDISIAQVREMKKIFNEEKLYYDFLR